MCACCRGSRSNGKTRSSGILNSVPKKEAKWEEEIEEGCWSVKRTLGGCYASLATISPLSSPPMVHNASLLEGMAPSGASCVKSRSAAEEKQIADLSSTGPQCV